MRRYMALLLLAVLMACSQFHHSLAQQNGGNCGIHCPKPWAASDRWFDADSNGLFNSDAGDYYDPLSTGYTDTDVFLQISLVLGNGNDPGFAQFWYYPIDLPPTNDGIPVLGADQYSSWLCESCLDSSVDLNAGDLLSIEPGSMVGPSDQGLRCIMDSDPEAQWDADGDSVTNSAYEISPRIVRFALFDPAIGVDYGTGARPVLHVVKVQEVFIESRSGLALFTARILRILLTDPDNDGVLAGCDNCPGFFNPDQADSNGDLIGDACDCNCSNQGDFDTDGFRTALDLGVLIDLLYGGGDDIQDPACPALRADFDCDGYPTGLDLAAMIEHVFVGGAGPCNPCVAQRK